MRLVFFIKFNTAKFCVIEDKLWNRVRFDIYVLSLCTTYLLIFTAELILGLSCNDIILYF